MNTKSACFNELKSRMGSAKQVLSSAFNSYKHGDFLQCAVRLQELDRFGSFTELEMNVFEAESGKEAQE